LAINPRANLWLAWLGLNLSHSLGLVVFGSGLFAISTLNFALFADSLILEIAIVTVAAAYFALSVHFWFWGPAVGSGAALACFLTAGLLVRLV